MTRTLVPMIDMISSIVSAIANFFTSAIGLVSGSIVGGGETTTN